MQPSFTATLEVLIEEAENSFAYYNGSGN
jgi:hypothetical protein